MFDKKVSIVLPVYNGESHVKHSIKSILSQEYKNIELVIVNDCSTDNTLEIVSTFSDDNRVRIISNGTNQKLPRSLNIGFREATGEYLTWTSDDNKYHSDAILKMVNVLEENKDVDLVYADFTKYDMQGNIIETVKFRDPSDIRFGSCIGACFLYRRELAERTGEYNPECFLAEDYEFFIRCYKNGRFYHIAEDLYDYGCHDASLTATKAKEITRQTFLVKDMHFDFLLSQCESQADRNAFFHAYLSLIHDKKKKRNCRKKIYKTDQSFAAHDIVERIHICLINGAKMPVRIIKHITRSPNH